MPLEHIILVTGPPGVGKTRIIKKIIEQLKTKNVSMSGFVTEECRSSGVRTGFDVVDLNGNKNILARIGPKSHYPCIGKYNVYVKSFEDVCLGLISPPILGNQTLVVVDEIGKMELLSSRFKIWVQTIASQEIYALLATIPVRKGKPIPEIEKLRSNPKAIVFEISYQNRTSVSEDILKTILEKCPFTKQMV